MCQDNFPICEDQCVAVAPLHTEQTPQLHSMAKLRCRARSGCGGGHGVDRSTHPPRNKYLLCGIAWAFFHTALGFIIFFQLPR